MSDTSLQSDLLGLVFGLTPGILLGVIGLALGGEWAWNLGFIALWLILFGLLTGPVLGWIGPEFVAERPTVVGAVVGLLPGSVYAAFRFDDAGWLSVLAIIAGSILGALFGHRVFRRSVPSPMPPLLRRRPSGPIS